MQGMASCSPAQGGGAVMGSESLCLALAHCLWKDAWLELGPTVWADRTFLQCREPEALSFCPAQEPGGL